MTEPIQSKSNKDIPVSVFTGFLGAGKTTIILSLLRQLPADYKVCLLKNEFGDVEVDSELAKESSIQGVSEILNGCMCCVLVGQMRTALLEIKEKYSPDRIIIESSGSAFPATLAWQVRQLEDEGLKLDAVATVIDCLNFKGYEDTSPTAKMQAKYTDLLLLNKHELTTERQLDSVLDSLYELNPETPKLRISRDAPVAPSLIFGLLAVSSFSSSDDSSTKTNGEDRKESKVFGMKVGEMQDRKRLGLVEGEHASETKGEVETVSIWSGGTRPGHSHAHSHSHNEETHIQSSTAPIDKATLEALLAKLPSEDIWRVKGFLFLSTSPTSSDQTYYILNWAFGRHELHQASEGMSARLAEQGVRVRLTMMGARGEVKKRAKLLAGGLGASVS